MADLWSALSDPNLPFLRYALGASLLAAVAFGTVGTLVVVRRISYLAGAIAHSVLGGIGLALYLQSRGWTWFTPMLGALLAGIAGALTIGLASIYAREREDSVIGAIWALGMALGLLFIAQTPGYVDPMSYLFGNIMLVDARDLLHVLLLDIALLILTFALLDRIAAAAFDEDFARLRGVRVETQYLGLLIFIALTVVVLVNLVGIILVIALLTLPAALAGRFAVRLPAMMGLAVLFSLLFSAGGVLLAWPLNLPIGPTIVLLAASIYLAVLLIGTLKRRPGM